MVCDNPPPFDDGNGRIARAIADLMLARSEASAQRFDLRPFLPELAVSKA